MSLALPSLRADNFSMDIMSRLQKVRKGGLTFAPEAGTQRLRDAINKTCARRICSIPARSPLRAGGTA